MANAKYTLTHEQRQEYMQQLTDQLEEGIRSVFESERYAEYLKTMSKFTNYSVNNTILIAMQTGGRATMVAGYDAWKTKFGRQVNRGEKAIKIFAPMTYQRKEEVDVLDPNTGQPVRNADGSIQKETREVTVPTFRVTNVFDISQTSGPPLPIIVDNLEGNVERFDDFVKAIQHISPVSITFEPMEGKDGFYDQIEQRIAIKEGMSEVQSMAALIHELGHAKLHALDPKNLRESAKARGKDQRTMEVEAESIAAVVSSYFGIDTSANSWGYVASWSKNKELPELKASLQIIKDTAGEIIDGIVDEMEFMKYHHITKEAAMEEVTKGQQVYRNYTRGRFQEVTPEEIEAAPDKAWFHVLKEQFREKSIDVTKLSFYVAVSEEFPEMGDYFDGLTLEEAIEKYKEIRQDPRLGYFGNALGFKLNDPDFPDYQGSTYPLIMGNTIHGHLLDEVEAFASHPMILEALKEVKTHFPEYRYHPPKAEKANVYPEKMSDEEITDALIELSKEAFRDPNVDSKEIEDDRQEIQLALQIGKGREYFGEFLSEVIHDKTVISPKAEALLEKLKAHTPDYTKEYEPVVEITYSQHPDLQQKDLFSLSEADAKIQEMNQAQFSQNQGMEEKGRIFLVSYTIHYAQDQQKHELDGSIFLGNGEGGLLEHIRHEVENNLISDSTKDFVEGHGTQSYEEYISNLHEIHDKAIPYFEQYCNRAENVANASKEDRESKAEKIEVDQVKAAENGVKKSNTKSKEKDAGGKTAKKAPKKSIHSKLKEKKDEVAKKPGKEELSPKKGVVI